MFHRKLSHYFFDNHKHLIEFNKPFKLMDFMKLFLGWGTFSPLIVAYHNASPQVLELLPRAGGYSHHKYLVWVKGVTSKTVTPFTFRGNNALKLINGNR